MTTVTVPGADGTPFSMNFGDSEVGQFASIAVLDLDAAPPEDVNVHDIADSGATTVAGAYNELTDAQAGTYAVGAGWSYLAANVLDPRDDGANGFLATGGYAGSTQGDLSGAVLSLSASSSSFTAGTGLEDIYAAEYMTISAPASAGGLIAAPSYDILSLATGDWVALVEGQGDDVTLGTGSSTVSAGSYNLVFAGTGTADVMLESSDLFVGASGAASVSLEGGDNEVFAGSGAITVNASGFNNDVEGGAGPATVTLGGDSNVASSGSGSMIVFVEGAGDVAVCNGGSGPLTVVNSGTGTLFYDNSGNEFGGPGSVVTFFGDASGASLRTTDTPLFLVSGGGADTITGALGQDVGRPQAAPVVFGAAGCDITVQNEESGAFLTAGGGDETIDASKLVWGGTAFFAGTGNDTLIGNAGGQTFFLASTGNATMTGALSGSGNDLYEFVRGEAGGTDLITNFDPGSALFLSGYGTSPDAGIANETATGAGVQLDLTDGTTITFGNLTSTAALDGHIFHI